MSTVKEMLDNKGRVVHTIGPDESAHRAIELMSEVKAGALPVLSEDKLVGIISERDYARKVILLEKSPHDIAVSEIMTTDVFTAREETTTAKCMAMMTHHSIRHLPIVDGPRLVGIIAVGDLLKFVVNQQASMIEALQSYIMDETGGSG